MDTNKLGTQVAEGRTKRASNEPAGADAMMVEISKPQARRSVRKRKCVKTKEPMYSWDFSPVGNDQLRGKRIENQPIKVSDASMEATLPNSNKSTAAIETNRLIGLAQVKLPSMKGAKRKKKILRQSLAQDLTSRDSQLTCELVPSSLNCIESHAIGNQLLLSSIRKSDESPVDKRPKSNKSSKAKDVKRRRGPARYKLQAEQKGVKSKYKIPQQSQKEQENSNKGTPFLLEQPSSTQLTNDSVPASSISTESTDELFGIPPGVTIEELYLYTLLQPQFYSYLQNHYGNKENSAK